MIDTHCHLTDTAFESDFEAVRETIRHCPIDRILLETDAPYLAPVPYRGTRNEPAYVREVALCIAKVKELPFEEVDHVTSENAMRFFGLLCKDNGISCPQTHYAVVTEVFVERYGKK